MPAFRNITRGLLQGCQAEFSGRESHNRLRRHGSWRRLIDVIAFGCCALSMDVRQNRARLVHVQAGAAEMLDSRRDRMADHAEHAARRLQPAATASIAQRSHARSGVADSDRAEAKAEASRSNATAIAGCDKVAEMIGQVPSAITLGFMAKHGEKIAISGLPRRRLDGRPVAKERVCGGEIRIFAAAARLGSGIAYTDNTPNDPMGHEGDVQGKPRNPRGMQGSSGPLRAVVLIELARPEGRRSALTRHCRVRT